MYLHLHPKASVGCRNRCPHLLCGNEADDVTVKTLKKWGYVGIPSELKPCPATAVVHEDESQSSRGCS